MGDCMRTSYSLDHLLDDGSIGATLPFPPAPATINYAFTTLISFYTNEMRKQGAEDAFFDAKIHHYKLAVSGNGPRTRGRYYGVQRRDALPAPFPLRASPTSVFTITSAALNPKSPKSRALPYFHGILARIHSGLEAVVHATMNSSVAAWPHDRTHPVHWPQLVNVLLPPFKVQGLDTGT